MAASQGLVVIMSRLALLPLYIKSFLRLFLEFIALENGADREVERSQNGSVVLMPVSGQQTSRSESVKNPEPQTLTPPEQQPREIIANENRRPQA